MAVETGNRLRTITSKAHRLYDAKIAPHLGYGNTQSAEAEHFGHEFSVFRNLASELVDYGFTPDMISLAGGIARASGSVMLGRPFHVQELVERQTGKQPHIASIAVIGGISWAFGLVCDAVDGEMAAEFERRGIDRNKIKGRVVDGLTDASSLLFLSQLIKKDPDTPEEASGWGGLDFFSFATNTIRAGAEGEGVHIGKASTGSQVGIEAITMGSHLFELFQRKRARGHLGAILTWVRAQDAVKRYKVVLDSGNKDAIKRVNTDLIQLAGVRIFGKALSSEPFLAFLLELIKVGDVMSGEKNDGIRVSDLISNELQHLITRVGANQNE